MCRVWFVVCPGGRQPPGHTPQTKTRYVKCLAKEKRGISKRISFTCSWVLFPFLSFPFLSFPFLWRCRTQAHQMWVGCGHAVMGFLFSRFSSLISVWGLVLRSEHQAERPGGSFPSRQLRPTESRFSYRSQNLHGFDLKSACFTHGKYKTKHFSIIILF